MDGFAVSKKLEKLGWHASDTAELSFDDVFVPEENLLGEENHGFYLIMANFQWERLLMALGAVGSMERVLEMTLVAPSAGVRPADRQFQVIAQGRGDGGQARGLARPDLPRAAACSQAATTRSAR